MEIEESNKNWKLKKITTKRKKKIQRQKFHN